MGDIAESSGLDAKTARRDAEEAALWEAFAADSSDLARSRIFAFYAPFARRVARRLYRERNWGDIEQADLQQYAIAGLLEAINRFDPARGVPFRPFAIRRITGSVRDGIARMSELREQMAWRGRLQRERVRSLVDEPSDASPVARLSELTLGLALGYMLEGSGVALEAPGGARNAETAYDSVAWKEMLARLHHELERLSEREQMILRQHYLNGLSFDQLAELLSVSKGRVSQLHRAALAILRKRLQARGFSGIL